MAKINIYGTLHNDTGEPIVAAEQVSVIVGSETKMLPEYLNSLAEHGSEELTEADMAEILIEAKQQASDTDSEQE